MNTAERPKMRPYTFLMTEELGAALKALKERDGTPESEAIRRAIAEYLERRGITATVARTTARRTPPTRRTRKERTK